MGKLQYHYLKMAIINFTLDKSCIPFTNTQPLQSHYCNMALQITTTKISRHSIKSLSYGMSKVIFPFTSSVHFEITMDILIYCHPKFEYWNLTMKKQQQEGKVGYDNNDDDDKNSKQNNNNANNTITIRGGWL